MKLKILPVLVLSCLGLNSYADACYHRPRGVNRAFEQSAQQAIIVHHNGYEDLIIRVKYKFSGPGQNPDNLAWLIPTPNAPISYKTASDELFKEAMRIFPTTNRANDLARRGRVVRTKRRPRENKSESLKLLNFVLIGNYRIQPIQATGPEAATELNRWLDENGYGTVPVKNMAWYLKNKWTFLAIKLTSKVGKKGLPDEGTFKPLHLRFKSKKIIYPLKFSSHQGVFNVSLYVITSQWLNRHSSMGQREWDPERFKQLEEVYYRNNLIEGYWAFWQAAKYGFEVASTCRRIRYKGFGKGRRAKRRGARLTNKYEPHLYRLLTVIDARDPLPEFLFLNKFVGRKVNGARNKVEEWPEDFSLDYLKQDKQLKSMRPVRERFDYLLRQLCLHEGKASRHHLVNVQVYAQLTSLSDWQQQAIQSMVELRANGRLRSQNKHIAEACLNWALKLIEDADSQDLSIIAVVKALGLAFKDIGQSGKFLSGVCRLASTLLDSPNIRLRLFAMTELDRQFKKQAALRNDSLAMECVMRALIDPDQRIRNLAAPYRP